MKDAMNKKILVFTGAGIDKESGVETFRDSDDGLWNNFRIEDVATMDGWRRNKSLVLDFYNQRRAQLRAVEPNAAHMALVDLESDFQVTIFTQNVSDLQERAGSTNVMHLHGELLKAKSSFPGSDETIDWEGDISIGDKCSKGSQLRPAVVWFGENLDGSILGAAEKAASECDICIIVGTSMQVAPANQIPFLTKEDCIIFYVDPSEADFYVPEFRKDLFIHIKEHATTGMQKIKEILNNMK
jgi:NAD-dependent deacetylase